eukprot:TRINITY_DN42041_c0_g1_i1.p1 TRINITY_DN42041_c0_g1~~TRINITY_DN42041_c0_g1_i1.p1  ORF type:complete len:386 (+),score=58.02 TRINITY_DN42041_c0_g1_i1:46-1203(+)
MAAVSDLAKTVGPHIVGHKRPYESLKEGNRRPDDDQPSPVKLHQQLPGQSLVGVSAIAASAFSFSLMSAGVRMVSDDFPATQTMFIRSSIQSIFSFSFLFLKGLPILGSQPVRRWVILRGFVGAATNWIMYFAVTQISLGDANALIFTAPVFTALLSCVLLHEPFAMLEALAVLTSVAGVLLVSRPPFLFGSDAAEHDSFRTATSMARAPVVAMCLVGACLNGSIFIIVRHIGKEAHWMSLVFSFSLNGCVLSSLALAAGIEKAKWPEFSGVGVGQYAQLLVIAALAILGQSLFNFGMQREKAAMASITRQLDVPFCFLWQVVVFQEPAVWLSVTGAILVLSSTTLALGRKLMTNPPQAQVQKGVADLEEEAEEPAGEEAAREDA